MYFRMQRAVALAVQSVRVGPLVFFRHPDVRGFIKLWVDLQQVAEAAGPRLMAEQIDLRYDPDVMPLAFVDDLFDICFGQRNAVAQLGMAFELIVVIHTKQQRIYLARSEFVANELYEWRYRLLARSGDADPPYRKYFGQLVLRT